MIASSILDKQFNKYVSGKLILDAEKEGGDSVQWIQSKIALTFFRSKKDLIEQSTCLLW